MAKVFIYINGLPVAITNDVAITHLKNSTDLHTLQEWLEEAVEEENYEEAARLRDRIKEVKGNV